jgi:hypothetical protein
MCLVELPYATPWKLPSIVPDSDDQDAYLVVGDFGSNGRIYREWTSKTLIWKF